MYPYFIISFLTEIKDSCNSKDTCKNCKFSYHTETGIHCLFEALTPSDWNIEAIRRIFYDI